MHNRSLAALSAAALLALAAPAAAQGDRAAKLLTDRPAPRRECRINDRPSPLPSISQLADSATLAAGVAQYAAEYPVRGRMHAVYSVTFDKDGALERLLPVDYLLPVDREESLRAIVRGALKPQARGGYSLRLRVEHEGTPSFRVGYSETCPPALETRFELAAPAMEQRVSLRPIRLELFVDTEGHVGDIRVASSSGNDDIDRWVAENVSRWRFGPGLVDEQVVGMNHIHTVRLRSRGGPASNDPNVP